MIKTRGGKVILYLIITFCVIAFSLSGLAIFNFTNKRAKETTAADLTIYDADQLKSFIADVRAGNDYNLKRVVLGGSFNVGTIEPIGYYEKNIIYGTVTQDHETRRGFNGIFDGQNHTLSNIIIKGDAYYYHTFQFNANTRQGSEEHVVRTALFGALGGSAKICNLKITNITYGGGIDITQNKPYMTISITQTPSAAIFTDCDAGATFSNIKIENTNGFNSGFGSGLANVYNCELCDSKGKGFGVKCANSVFKQQQGYYCSSPFGSNSSNCVSSPNQITDFTCSSVGGNSSLSGFSSSVWYYASGYNDGYPTLRQFMSWKEFYVMPGVNAEGVVFFNANGELTRTNAYGDNRQYCLVPNTDDSVLLKNTIASGSTLTVFDQLITSNLEEEKYSSITWRKWEGSVRDYFLDLEYQTYIITFDFSSVTDKVQVISTINGNTTTELRFDVNWDCSLNINYTMYAKENAVKGVEFEFNDLNEQKIVVKVNIKNSQYYITNIVETAENMDLTYGGFHGMIRDEDYTVIISKKSYGVEFK